MLLISDNMRDTRSLPRNKRTSANNVALEGRRQEMNEGDREPIASLKKKTKGKRKRHILRWKKLPARRKAAHRINFYRKRHASK